MNWSKRALWAFAAAVMGCGESLVDAESMPGEYTATEFTVGTTDVLAAGGDLVLSLSDSRTVAGRLYVPAGAGGLLEADMDGVYSSSNDIVRFEQVADTFVRDAEWRWRDGVLTTTFRGSEESIRVSLERL